MKTCFFIGIALLGLIGSADAQERQAFYVKVDGGMAMGLANDNITTNNHIASNGVGTIKSTNTTLGEGFKGTLGVGYLFPSNFGIEAGVIYSAGLRHTGTYVDDGAFGGQDVTAKMKDRSGLVYLNARYLITTNQRFQPYLRLGIMATAWGKLTVDEDNKYLNYIGGTPTVTSHYIMTTECKYYLTLGMNGAFGCNYKLNDRLSIYGELNMAGISRSLKKSTLTKYNNNGVDALSTLSTSSREQEYKKKAVETNDSSKPEQLPSLLLPMSYVGISFGIQFSI